MIYWATQEDVDDGEKIITELRKRYLPTLNLIGKDLLGDYKAFELPYIVRRIQEQKGKKILDFGAGTSCLPAYLDSLGYEVWALDNGSWHPEVNEKTYNETYRSHIKYIVDDILENPDCVPDDYFDVIYSASVLEHIPNYERYLNALNKKLKNGGLSIHIMDARIPPDIYQPQRGIGRLVITNK